MLVPSAALAVLILLARDNIKPCADGCYPGGNASVPVDRSECGLFVSTQGGETYCDEGQPIYYLRTLGMVHFFLHWTLIYSKPYRLMLYILFGLVAFLTVSFWVAFWADANDPNSLTWQESSTLNGSSIIDTAIWIVLANFVGALHYAVRNKGLWQHLVLWAQQQRSLRALRKETEKCEALLANILPPHLIDSLGGVLASHLQLTHDSERQRSFGNHALPTPRALSALTPRPQADKHLIAERYQHCSFLFAKIGGLSKLVNDDGAEPSNVITVLQQMFDRFDALAELFKVQKVRKTANEYYLAAAGLPDQELLPTPEARACGLASYGFAIINVMDGINLELRNLNMVRASASYQTPRPGTPATPSPPCRATGVASGPSRL